MFWLGCPLQSKVLAAFGHSMEFGCRFLRNDGTSKAAIPESLLAAFLLCVELLVFFCFVSLLAFLGQLLLFGILLDKFVQFFFASFNKISTVGASPAVFNAKKNFDLFGGVRCRIERRLGLGFEPGLVIPYKRDRMVE